MALIGPKHKGEKFLIATTSHGSSDAITRLFEAAKLSFNTAVFVKPVSQDLHDLDLGAYELAVFYNPSDVKSLQENFPSFKGEGLKFITFGKHIVEAMEEAGLPIEIKAPTPQAPSAAKAIEIYLQGK